ncbi:unnamed protein product [Darwinula stevensoni]|uniref:BTB domain-containing protein n=1 Tax=Darwinula stevensoni TaxID=69355 RepID=A0A7R8X1Y2_9CRUS|nr:unnamed protein product [Darwinula stevensoni]CAG0880585.1 unnamed protein product [Darwinula stevensoni]
MMNPSQQYCLTWNNHQSNLVHVFTRLWTSQAFTDCTLSCEGKFLKAHKVKFIIVCITVMTCFVLYCLLQIVLSACSTYFETLFSLHSEKHPVIILRDTSFADIKSVVEFMYRGEINVSQQRLESLLRTAESLKIKGLAETSSRGTPKPTAIQGNTVTPGIILPMTVTTTASQGQVQGFFSTLGLVEKGKGIIQATTNSANANINTSTIVQTKKIIEKPLDTVKVYRRKRPSQGDAEMEPDTKKETPEDAEMQKEDGEEAKVEVEVDPMNTLDQVEEDDGQASHASSSDQNLEEGENSSLMVQESSNVSTPVSVSPSASPAPAPSMQKSPAKKGGSTVPLSDLLPLDPSQIIKMDDYMQLGKTRREFWDEPSSKMVLDFISNNVIDLKTGADLLGVSYANIYTRYREAHGYLNQRSSDQRSPRTGRRSAIDWSDESTRQVMRMIADKVITIKKGAEMLGVEYSTMWYHISHAQNHPEKFRL